MSRPSTVTILDRFHGIRTLIRRIWIKSGKGIIFGDAKPISIEYCMPMHDPAHIDIRFSYTFGRLSMHVF